MLRKYASLAALPVMLIATNAKKWKKRIRVGSPSP
tara:strand:- start:208 stop:312 length:105 start_codon:yes stop_codon:yes gene_type:complete